MAVPIEDVDAFGAAVQVVTRQAAEPLTAPLLVGAQAAGLLSAIGVEAAVEGDVPRLAEGGEALDLGTGVGAGITARDDEIAELFADPGLEVVADVAAGFEGGGDADSDYGECDVACDGECAV